MSILDPNLAERTINVAERFYNVDCAVMECALAICRYCFNFDWNKYTLHNTERITINISYENDIVLKAKIEAKVGDTADSIMPRLKEKCEKFSLDNNIPYCTITNINVRSSAHVTSSEILNPVEIADINVKQI